MHIAVSAVVPDHGVPASDLDESGRIDHGQPVIREELDRPSVVATLIVLFVTRLLRFPDHVDGTHVKGLVRDLVFVRLGNDVHVAPEVVGEVVVDGLGKVEILELGKGLKGRSSDDINAEDFSETIVVQVEGVFGGETAVLVGVHCASIFDDVNIFGRPSCCDVADYNLLQ